jgi:FKBP-type peptidyl-prolyl cis-trans isomerase FklB
MRAWLRTERDLRNACDQWENVRMRKTLTTIATILTVGALLLPAAARSQQTAPPATPQQPAASTPPKPAAPKAQTAPGAKTGQKPAVKPPLALKTQKEKASYAIGLSVGKSLQKDSIDIDTAILLRGLKDALAGGKTLLSDEEAKAAIGALQVEMRKKQEEKMAIAGQANQKEGEAFLAANKAKDGVVTLPSGLQYKILTTGTGPKPAPTDSVVCNYRGTLINNTEFDSSYKRGQPAKFPVTGVIKGWTEALQLMPVGSKWQLFVPADLAYGPRAAGPDIGPNSTLIFEVELLSIEPKTPASPAPEAPKQ